MSLFVFLLLVIFRRKPHIVQVDPVFPQSESVLDGLAKWAVRLNLASFAIDLAPELYRYSENPRRFYFQDVFKKYEPWQDDYFNFNLAEQQSPTYGYAFKALTCTYVYEKVLEIFLLDSLVRRQSDKKLVFIGLSPDTVDFYQTFFNVKVGLPISRLWVVTRLFNLCLSFFVMLATVMRMGFRVRIFMTPVPVDLAFDWLKDIREFNLLSEIADCGRILLIDRFPGIPRNILPPGLDIIHCGLNDGYFRPWQALSASVLAVRDIFSLFGAFGHLAPKQFYRVAVLPDKKLRIRSLFTRFPPRNCLGRDEYNVEHILRTQELRRIDVSSLGLTNSFVTTWASLAPNVRYVSYDKYYVFSAEFLKDQAHTWRKDMEVTSIGSYAISREGLTTKVERQRDEILISMRVGFSSDEMIGMVRMVAEAFPKITVLLQLRKDTITDLEQREISRRCTEGLNNVKLTTEEIYELMARCRYQISDVSGIIAEAIQIGNTVFFADVLEMEHSIYRLFPRLSVKTAEELVERLSALENKTEVYPHEEYLGLFNLSTGQTAFDIMRTDLGLPLR